MKQWSVKKGGFFFSLPFLGRFLRYYSVFRKLVGDKALFLVIISIFSTLTEGAGIAAFIAYMQYLAAPGTAPSSIIVKMQDLYAFFHIPFTTAWVLSTLVVVFAIRGLLVFAGRGYQFRVHIQMLSRVNDEVSRAIASMNYSEYVKRSSGFFTHLVTKEVWRTTTAFYQISAMIPIAISICVYLALSLRMDWRFTLLAGFFGGITAVVFKSVITGTMAESKKMSAAEAQLSSLVIQLLQSFKYLFSTASLSPLQKKITVSANEVATTGSRIGYLSAILPASSETIIVIFMSVMTYFQTVVFERRIESMIVAMLFLYRAMKEATTLQGSWQTFSSYLGGVDSLLQTLDDLSLTSEKRGGQAFRGIQRGIEINNVSFQYGQAQVLKNISLLIPANSMVAFVGESGAGKSTMVDLLTGLLLPVSGGLRVDNVEYKDLDRHTLREQIGYVTQESVVFDDTIANNVSLWRWESEAAGEARVNDALKRASCTNFVNNQPAGIQEFVGERGIRLSGGQRQRLSIARELYKNPALLILDEATSALDSESERQVQESIDALKGTTTIVMIAHRLATVRNCDLIFVLKEGQVVEHGSFEELKAKSGVFRRMCEAQSLA